MITIGNLIMYSAHIERIQSWTSESLEQGTRDFCKTINVPIRDLAMGVRVVLTGKSKGLGLYDIMNIFGKENTINRLNDGIAMILDRFLEKLQ